VGGEGEAEAEAEAEAEGEAPVDGGNVSEVRGGGCSCEVGGTARGQGAPALIALGLAAALVGWRRRRD